MNKQLYQKINDYMKIMMGDSAHDYLHIYRVLNKALDISKNYIVNKDILIIACLLHDIGRQKQFENPNLCHAIEGGKMAYDYLKSIGFNEEDCKHVQDCITTHRFRSNNEPKTIEAKILFDCDKLDVCGCLGISRTLMYQGKFDYPLYEVDESNNIIYNNNESFIREYNYKLINVYDKFYTKEAKEIALQRKKQMESFYESLIEEININDLNDKLNLE